MVSAVVHGHDVRMVERRSGSRLDLEAPTVVRLHAEHRIQQLDRDWPIQPGVPAVANLGHATAAKNPPQFIAAAKNLWRLHHFKLARRRRTQTNRATLPAPSAPPSCSASSPAG